MKILTAEEMKSPGYRSINPTGAVPALDDGDFRLTQNAAILGYIADRFPAAGLAGDGSARDRAKTARWLAFVGSDIHPTFHLLFFPGRFIEDAAQHEALKRSGREQLRRLFERANEQLDGREWIAGFRSVADPYLYIVLRWAELTGVDLEGLAHLDAFRRRMDADPGARAALEAEGLT